MSGAVGGAPLSAAPPPPPAAVLGRPQQLQQQRGQQPLAALAAGRAAAAPLDARRRRDLLLLLAAGGASAALPAAPAAASKLPEFADRVWSEQLGGGPADLTFPGLFEGEWEVDSVLTSVETPLGPEMVPDAAVVARAREQDLNARVRYRVAFRRNARGEVVPDRAYNTAALVAAYMPALSPADVARRVAWDVDDPNQLRMSLPGGLEVTTRVTRRSEEADPARPDRLSTSEFFQQLIETPERPRPRVKASQCFTKYLWRSADAAAAGGGHEVVATQVVSDYVSGFDDPKLMMAAGGKPVVVYTYKMAFKRAAAAGVADAAGAAAG